MVKSTADKNEKKIKTISIENQPKILIIDDERLLRQSLKRILEKAGFYCEMAMDYSSAKKNIENLDFDAILVDIILPKMNGIELITKLQEDLSINAAIIFITGEPNLETCRKAIKIGAFNYLEKPVSRKLLIESIKQALIRRNNQISFKKKEG
ncbi:MAG: response regulator, partial [Promethearchaeota archaeon]